MGKIVELNILNSDIYERLVVETERGEKIAEVTMTEVTSAEGFRVRLKPKAD